MNSTRPLQASVLSEADYDAWDRFVAGQERTGSIYSSAQYLDIFCRAAGGSFSVFAIRDGDDFVAGIGLYRRRALGHEVLSYRWLLSYNGPVVRNDLLSDESASATRLAALELLRSHLDREPVAGVSLHCRDGNQDFSPFADSGWRLAPTSTIVVPTTDSRTLWNRLDRNARRLVRRAEEAGCGVAADDDFDALYRTHEEVHRRKDAPLYLREAQFRRLVDGLLAAGLAKIYTARLADGSAAAAQLVLLGQHRCSHTVCAGSHEEHLSTGAAYLLRWRAFVDLEARGYAMNDLTDASPGPVTRFKEQLGGDLKMNMLLWSRYKASYRLLKRGSEWYGALRARLRFGAAP